jgi:hypothetical protein
MYVEMAFQLNLYQHAAKMKVLDDDNINNNGQGIVVVVIVVVIAASASTNAFTVPVTFAVTVAVAIAVAVIVFVIIAVNRRRPPIQLIVVSCHGLVVMVLLLWSYRCDLEFVSSYEFRNYEFTC